MLVHKTYKIAFVFLLIVSLMGCQKTPDKESVVNKSGGLPEGAVIEPMKPDQTKSLDVPKHWSETLERGNGQLTITADLDISLPEVFNTPIWEIEQETLTEARLEELVRYFTGDEPLYEPPGLTEQEIKDWIQIIENTEGMYGNPWTQPSRGRYIKNLKQLLPDAPKEWEYKETKIKFRKPIETDRQFVAGNGLNMVERPGQTEENVFGAVLNMGESSETIVTAVTRNEIAGTSSEFAYHTGLFFDEQNIQEEEENIEVSKLYHPGNNWMKANAELMNQIRIMLEEIDITEETAIEQAEGVLQDLGCKGMVQSDIYRGAWVEEDDIYQADWSKAKTGYRLTYYRDGNGIPAFYSGNPGVWYKEENLYAPPFLPETIVVTVTADGIQDFEWSNMAKITETVAENTALASWDTIKEKLQDHLFYAIAGTVEENKDNGADASKLKSYYTVTDVQLRYTYCTAYGDPTRAWLIPAWVISAECVRVESGPSGEVTIPARSGDLMFNALDGGYIDVQ